MKHQQVATRNHMPTTLDGWEELCEGTYPGYALNGVGSADLESRAYASLSEVIDESAPDDWLNMLLDRRRWTAFRSTASERGKVYEPDQRIANLVELLLTHGWEPPQNIAYTQMHGGGERDGRKG